MTERRQKWYWVFGAMLAAIALGAFGLWLALTGRVEPDQPSASLVGVDVSHHQGAIDWVALSGDRVDFAFIKATEGGDWVDPAFYDNWQAAKRAGVLRGAYHFFTVCRDGARQGEHFLAVVGNMQGAFVPALDAEHMGPCRDGPMVADVAEHIGRFLDVVEAETGARPVIYTTEEFYQTHLYGRGMTGERFWLRSIFNRPDFGPHDWAFWQYSSRGRRRGVSGPVDLNVFASDGAELEALIVR